MAESESPGGPRRANLAGHPVIEAGKTAVGLLRLAYDADLGFSRAGTAALLDGLSPDELIRVCAVQTVWILEQMEWIAQVPTKAGDQLGVGDQIAQLGIEIARNESGA